MRKYFLVFILLSISPFFVNILKSQGPPCFPEDQGLFYEIPVNPTNPPFSTDMPYDVLIGYIAMDSLSKNVEIEDYYSFLSRQKYNDTIRTMMRYFYQMMEYNPAKYLDYKYYGLHSKFPPMDYEHSFYNHLLMTSPVPILDASLLASFFIGKVTIYDVNSYIDTNARWAVTASKVSARIDTIFKGHSIENCPNPPSVETPYNQNCMKFEIAKEWFDDIDFFNTITTQQSFFVFFEYRLICFTETSAYFTIFPLRFVGSLNNSIYPIVDNRLIDTNNELGFGESVDLNTFYNGIQNRINEIKNFTP